MSRTDVECQWKRKKAAETVQAAAEMFPPSEKKRMYNPLAKDPNEEDRAWLYDQLKDYGKFTGLRWVLCPEPEATVQLPIKSIEELIYSQEFLLETT